MSNIDIGAAKGMSLYRNQMIAPPVQGSPVFLSSSVQGCTVFYIFTIIWLNLNKGVPMKSLAKIFFVISIFFSYSVYAEESPEQTAEKLLELFDMQAILLQSTEQMLDLQLKQSPHLKPYRSTILKFFDRYMSWKSLKSDIIAIYAKEFSQEELEDMIAFYETPTGQKAIRKVPELMSKGALIGAQRVKNNIGELQQMLAEEVRANQ